MTAAMLWSSFASVFQSTLTKWPSSGTGSQCCLALEATFPGQVFWPDTPQYIQEAELSFWSNTSRLHPSCVFTPGSAEDVSGAIKLFEHDECQFAVRNGGHMPNPGAASIDDGVLVALTRLDTMSLSPDGDVFSVGAGQKWGPVFEYLDPRNLAVVGGRVSVVGVSGLILGCGLSHFSGKRGFACDNVKSFEVVLSGGRIVEASESSHPDLFWALKGGSSNFGIVTRFDLYTHPDTNFYLAIQSLDARDWEEIAVAIDGFMARSDYGIADDMAIQPKIQYIAGRDPEIVLPLISTLLPAPHDGWSTRKGLGLALPPGLQDFANLPFKEGESTGTHTCRVLDKLNVHMPYGLRNELRFVAFRSSVELLVALNNYIEDEVKSLRPRVPSFSIVTEIQPITKRNIREGYARGGNALGLTEDRGPLIWVVLVSVWLSEDDDELVRAAGQRIVDRTNALSQERGLHDPLLFLNDAGVGQDPIATYGQESIRKLREVKQRYDSAGTFDRLLPGGFKIPKT